MAKKVVTLYFDDTSIRLLVCKGKHVTRWAELPLQPGQMESAVITGEEEIASQLKQLLKDQKIKERKVIVGLSGLHCLTRPIVLPQLPKAMLNEAVIREAKRLLPVPLEQLYITWQTLPAPEGKTHVFLVAIPRRNADALLRMLRQVNLKPYIVGIKPLALARLVRQPTAIAVDVQPGEFDIVIMVDGIPQPIRTVPFPSQELSWQDKLSIITSDLDRTIQFYNSNSPDQPLSLHVPLYVSGEIAHQPELCQSLCDSLGYAVSPLVSPLKNPEPFDPGRYLVNIGLALQEQALSKMAGPSVASSNLLPMDYRPKPISLAKVLVVPAAIAIAAALVPLVMLISDISANIASKSHELALANHTLTERQVQRRELSGNIVQLENQLAQAKESLNAFTLALDSLKGQDDATNGDLEAIMSNRPAAVLLIGISCTGNSLTISGRAPSETEIFLYARSLESSGRFSQTTIAKIVRSECPGLGFALAVTR